MYNTLVSIVVPIYNTEKYLSRCIESILTQTYKNLEIILINDGSVDNSHLIMEKYAEKDERVRIINKENEGVSRARNIGISVAKGELIYFLDSDDYIRSDTVEKLVDAYYKNDTKLVVCGYTESKPEGCIRHHWGTDTISKEEAFEHILQPDGFGGYLWNKLFSKDIIVSNKIEFDENISIWEDLLFVITYVSKCNNIVLIDECLYTYCIRDDSAVSYLWFNDRLLTQIDAIEIIYSRNDLSKEAKSLLEIRLICCCLGIIRSMAISKVYDKKANQRCMSYIKKLGRKTYPYLSIVNKISLIVCNMNSKLFMIMYRLMHQYKISIG